MNLVDEQQMPVGGAEQGILLGLVQDVAHFFYARRNGAQRRKGHARFTGHQKGQSRFPDARRPPEQEGRQAFCGNGGG